MVPKVKTFNLFYSLGCGWWKIAAIIMNKKLVGSYTLAHSQKGTVYLLTKTVSFVGKLNSNKFVFLWF
jgi:hypothetical protein